MRYVAIIFLVLFALPTFAQKEKKESMLKSDRTRSFNQIKELKEEGALVLRLTLHKKNADLYRQAGNDKLADKLEKDLVAKINY